MSQLCELCRERAATVFVTKIINNGAAKHRLCAECARRKAGDGAPSSGAPSGELSLEEIVRSLFQQAGDASLWSGQQTDGAAEDENEYSHSGEVEAQNAETEDVEVEAAEAGAGDVPAFLAGLPWALTLGEFPADEDAVDALEDEDEEDEGDERDERDDAQRDGAQPFDADLSPGAAPSAPASVPTSTQKFGDAARAVRGDGAFASARCPKCGTTWDRLRHDGHAGCAQCYTAFAAQLAEVMGRVQRASQHAGKAPRAAEKRQRRLMHLRARRDHRLDLLRRRLKESVARENYSEAARLRDKIKILTSTIVDV